MSFISDDQLDQVREATDLVRLVGEVVPLKKAGRNYKGLCPFHTEKTPSFVVSPEKQIFHCFGCNEGGDAFGFLVKSEGLSFIEAVQLLASRAGIRLQAAGGASEAEAARTKKLLTRINRIAAEFFFTTLHQNPQGEVARRYLVTREIGLETARQFLVGYAPEGSRSLVSYLETKKIPLPLACQAGVIRQGQDGGYYDFFRNRLIFPIRNARGDFIGFGGRTLQTTDPLTAKYLNTADSPVYHKRNELYGLFEGKPAFRESRRAIVCEGYIDVLALVQHGFAGSVAPLGTALTAEQVAKLRRQVSELVVVFDSDAAGLKAAWQALALVLPVGLPTRMVPLPAGEDPDSFLKSEGREAFGRLLTGAPGLMDYFIQATAATGARDNLGKGQVVRQILPLLAAIPGNIEKTLYIRKLAECTGLGEEAIAKGLVEFQRGGRNFPPRGADVLDAKRQNGEALTLFEKQLLAALLAEGEEAKKLCSEVQASDWRHRELAARWPELGPALQQRSPLGKVIAGIQDPLLKRGLTEAILEEEGLAPADAPTAEDLVASCRRKLQKQRLEVQQQELTKRIREAELAADTQSIEMLLAEKNRLNKQMNQRDVR